MARPPREKWFYPELAKQFLRINAPSLVSIKPICNDLGSVLTEQVQADLTWPHSQCPAEPGRRRWVPLGSFRDWARAESAPGPEDCHWRDSIDASERISLAIAPGFPRWALTP